MLVKTENLKKYFQIGRGQTLHAVDGISVEIAENEILGLVGESGSGKSTFGKTLIGLHPRSGGTAYYQGEELPAKFTATDHLRFSKELQMIFQDPYSSLNPRMTVLDIVGEGLHIQGQHSRSQIREDPTHNQKMKKMLNILENFEKLFNSRYKNLDGKLWIQKVILKKYFKQN